MKSCGLDLSFIAKLYRLFQWDAIIALDATQVLSSQTTLMDPIIGWKGARNILPEHTEEAHGLSQRRIVSNTVTSSVLSFFHSGLGAL